MAKSGQNHVFFKLPKSRKNCGKITAKTLQQMAVNSLNTQVQSPIVNF